MYKIAKLKWSHIYQKELQLWNYFKLQEDVLFSDPTEFCPLDGPVNPDMF